MCQMIFSQRFYNYLTKISGHLYTQEVLANSIILINLEIKMYSIWVVFVCFLEDAFVNTINNPQIVMNIFHYF